MKKSIFGILALAVMVVPMFVLAQFGEVDSFFLRINEFINRILIPLVISIALLVFIWGVFKYFILGGGDSDKREEGRQLMLWAVIGFVLIVSIWGIVNLISRGLGFDEQNLNVVPNTVDRNR